MGEMASLLKASIGNGRELFGVIYFSPGLVVTICPSQKVVPISNFGGNLSITPK